MKDMNEKNIKLEEEFKKLKVEMWKMDNQMENARFKWQNFKRNIK